MFPPESFRPLPRAPSRKNKVSNRRKVKSVVLTDTPTKYYIDATEGIRKTNSMKRRITSKGKNKPKKIKETYKNEKMNDDEEDANNHCFCLVCLKAFPNRRSKEQ